MMHSPQEFFKWFQVNHFDYKQLSNQKLLDLSEEEVIELNKDVINSSVKEFRQSIIMDIRLTFLLSVETLFELVFGLLPDKNNQIIDSNLMLKLADKTFYNEEIRNYVKNQPSKLDNLKKEINFGDGRIGSILRHIFYFGIWNNDKSEEINRSLKVIPDALKILGSELSDREELNSFKHGFRSFSFLKSLILANKETLDPYIKFDADNSITIYSYDKKTANHNYLTKSLDYKRDIALTHYTSNLISNIIQPRKALAKIEKDSEIPIIFFFEDELEIATKSNVQLKSLRFTSPSK